MDKQLIELTAKVDKLLEMQEMILSKLNQGVFLPKENTVGKLPLKTATRKEERQQRIEKIREEITLKIQYGGFLQGKFNLKVQPSVQRIKAYLKTNDVSAFDGLKRNN